MSCYDTAQSYLRKRNYQLQRLWNDLDMCLWNEFSFLPSHKLFEMSIITIWQFAIICRNHGKCIRFCNSMFSRVLKFFIMFCTKKAEISYLSNQKFPPVFYPLFLHQKNTSSNNLQKYVLMWHIYDQKEELKSSDLCRLRSEVFLWMRKSARTEHIDVFFFCNCLSQSNITAFQSFILKFPRSKCPLQRLQNHH